MALLAGIERGTSSIAGASPGVTTSARDTGYTANELIPLSPRRKNADSSASRQQARRALPRLPRAPHRPRPVVEEEDAGIVQDPEFIPPRYQPEWGQRWSTAQQAQREGPEEAS
jgi:hypothetical protein